MPRIITHTALVAMLLSAATAAVGQAPQSSPPPVGSGGVTDGGMTLAQFQAAQAQRMMAADGNGDGRISQAEWAARSETRGAAGGHAGEPTGGYDPLRAFARLDSNGDGFIDRAELDAASAARFRRMDSNGDGMLTPDERAATRGGMGQNGNHHRPGAGQDGAPTPSSPQP